MEFRFTEASTEAVTVQTNQRKAGIFYHASIVEYVRIKPDPDRNPLDAKNPPIAFGILLFDNQTKEYISWAYTCHLAKDNKNLLRLLSAILNKNITSKNIPDSMDLDILIGKVFSVKFSQNGTTFPVLMMNYISPEKRQKYDISKYTQPAWITRQTLTEDDNLEISDELVTDLLKSADTKKSTQTPEVEMPKQTPPKIVKELESSDDSYDPNDEPVAASSSFDISDILGESIEL